jgi:hypothetical protein
VQTGAIVAVARKAGGVFPEWRTAWSNVGFSQNDSEAGWHICLDVLDRLLFGTPIGRTVGPDAMKFGGWQRLHAEYAKLFGFAKPVGRPNDPKTEK